MPPVALGLRGLGVGPAKGGYDNLVLGYAPIAYWPLWETAGATAHCLVNPAQDGTYAGVTLGGAAGPDGSPCPLFDGINDYVDVHTAALASVFNGLEGTFAIWERVYNVGVWTDAASRFSSHFGVDGGNFLRFYTPIANDTLTWYYRANTVGNLRNYTPYSNTTWFHRAMSWSDSANQTIPYLDGAQNGGIMAPGTWVGNIIRATIGAYNNTPNGPWHGWLAHVALWDRALTPGEITALATV